MTLSAADLVLELARLVFLANRRSVDRPPSLAVPLGRLVCGLELHGSETHAEIAIALQHALDNPPSVRIPCRHCLAQKRRAGQAGAKARWGRR